MGEKRKTYEFPFVPRWAEVESQVDRGNQVAGYLLSREVERENDDSWESMIAGPSLTRQDDDEDSFLEEVDFYFDVAVTVSSAIRNKVEQNDGTIRLIPDCPGYPGWQAVTDVLSSSDYFEGCTTDMVVFACTLDGLSSTQRSDSPERSRWETFVTNQGQTFIKNTPIWPRSDDHWDSFVKETNFYLALAAAVETVVDAGVQRDDTVELIPDEPGHAGWKSVDVVLASTDYFQGCTSEMLVFACTLDRHRYPRWDSPGLRWETRLSNRGRALLRYFPD